MAFSTYNQQPLQEAAGYPDQDVTMGNANSAMLENIVQTSNCTWSSLPYG
jgi:hypothetical protein